MRCPVMSVMDDINAIVIKVSGRHHIKQGDVLIITEEKKSLTQNGYYRSLIRELAKDRHTTVNFMHNKMLREVGIYQMAGEDFIYAVIPTDDNEVLEWEFTHLKPTNDSRLGKDGKIWTTYRMLKGTRDFNKEEMSHLISHTVDYANELHIPTMPEAEWKRLRLGK